MAKIYTKVGDKGQTSLIGGHRVLKSDARIESYGTIDELNSSLGLIRSELNSLQAFDFLEKEIEVIQHWLFDLGSLLASTPEDREKYKLPEIRSSHMTFLEEKIDHATAQLKPLKNFILPGGTELACRFHMARTISRRAERLMVALPEAEHPENAIAFINRLSDYFFTMARYANFLQKKEDILWTQSKSS